MRITSSPSSRAAFHFEAAKPEDAPVLASLLLEGYDSLSRKEFLAFDGEDRDWFHRQLSEGAVGITALHGERIVGFVLLILPKPADCLGRLLSYPEEPGKEAHLEFAMVSPDYRGHGLMKQMLKHLLLCPEASQLTRIYCTVHPENKPSLYSLEHSGFQIQETREMYGGLPRHILLLERKVQ